MDTLILDLIGEEIFTDAENTSPVQYISLVFSRRLQDAGILGSMGSVGDALDNAAAESFYATLQTELLDRYTWPTRQCLRSAIFEYIEYFYNRRRRHFALDSIEVIGCVELVVKGDQWRAGKSAAVDDV